MDNSHLRVNNSFDFCLDLSQVQKNIHSAGQEDEFDFSSFLLTPVQAFEGENHQLLNQQLPWSPYPITPLLQTSVQPKYSVTMDHWLAGNNNNATPSRTVGNYSGPQCLVETDIFLDTINEFIGDDQTDLTDDSKSGRGKRKYSPRVEASGGFNERRKWSQEESIVLVGIILDGFLHVGTLSYSLDQCPLSWEAIKILFIKAITKLKANSPPEEQTSHINRIRNRDVSMFRRAFKNIKIDSKKQNFSMRSIYNSWLGLNSVHNLIADHDYISLYQFKTKEKFEQNTVEAILSNEEDRRRNCWTYLQEIILTGSVCEYVFDNGSLSSNGGDCWTEIKQKFDLKMEMLDSTFNSGFGDRSKLALKRHFKVMRHRLQYLKFDSSSKYYFKNLFLAFKAQFDTS